RRARSVRTALGRIPACVSVHDPFGQAGSGQRQRRFRHRNLTGRPPTARSRTSVSRRPLETARTPHSGHPTTSVVVSTSIHTSPSTSTLASTRNPRVPNRSAAGSIPSTKTYGLLSQRLVATTKRSEAMGHITVFPDSPDAPSPPTRREEPISLALIASARLAIIAPVGRNTIPMRISAESTASAARSPNILPPCAVPETLTPSLGGGVRL